MSSPPDPPRNNPYQTSSAPHASNSTHAPTSGRAPEDPFLIAARREAVLTVVIWLAATAYSLTMYAWYGIPVASGDVILERPTLVFGFPWWVFWGVLVPWCVCTAITFVMTTFIMTDGELGPDRDEDDDAERLLTGKSAEVSDA